MRAHAGRLVLMAGAGLLLIALLVLRPWSAHAPAPAPPATAVDTPTAAAVQHPPSTPAPSATTIEPSASPSLTPTPTPPDLALSGTASSQGLTVTLRGNAPIAANEALLWYDAVGGRTPQRVALDGSGAISITLSITDPQALEQDVSRPGGLDMWWLLRDAGGRTFQITHTIALTGPLPQAQPRVPESFTWRRRETPHATLYYAPGSAAERDIEQIAAFAEDGYLRASSFFSPAVELTAPISVPAVPIYLVPRVFWQGGVAYGSGPLVISYLDRNYAGVEVWTYFSHEMTHALAYQLNERGVETGGMLGEGAAVYASGGHYASEPIRERAAALFALERAVPFCDLAYNFQAQQHEAAYLQGAAFIQFLIERFGAEMALSFYLTQGMPIPADGEQQPEFCARMLANEAELFGMSYGDLELEWYAWLGQTAFDTSLAEQLQLTLRYYDLMRRYQEVADKPARQLPGDPTRGWHAEELARLLTPANAPENVIWETMFIAASEALKAGDLPRAAQLLDEISAGLDADAPTGPLSEQYGQIYALTQQLARARRLNDQQAYAALLAPGAADAGPQAQVYVAFELEPQRISVTTNDNANQAQAIVRARWQSLEGQQTTALYALELTRSDAGWLVTSIATTTLPLPTPPERR